MLAVSKKAVKSRAISFGVSGFENKLVDIAFMIAETGAPPKMRKEPLCLHGRVCCCHGSNVGEPAVSTDQIFSSLTFFHELDDKECGVYDAMDGSQG